MKSRHFRLFSLVLFLLGSLFVFFACSGKTTDVTTTPSTSTTDSSTTVTQVPVYRGMQIVSGIEALSWRYDIFPGLHELSSTIDPDNPFDNPEGSRIEDLIAAVFAVDEPTDAPEYFADPEDEVIIRVMIENPAYFEILSFTLNAMKYQSYQFEEGSDSENLYLKITVGNLPGIRSFTIDQIKYVDGTEIKDAAIGGDQTITVGVRYPDFPELTTTDVALAQSEYEFELSFSDPGGVLSREGTELKAFLFDGISLIEDISIDTSTGSLVFDGLDAGTLYQYAVVGLIDDLDGTGPRLAYLAKDFFFTESYVLITSITSSKDAISFDIAIDDPDTLGAIASISLYQGEDLVATATDIDAREFTDLLTDNTYSVVIDYAYDLGDASGIRHQLATATIATDSRTNPTYSLSEVTSGQTDISILVALADPDNTIIEASLALYAGDSLIEEKLSVVGLSTFSGLDLNTDYTIRIDYEYDLGDGTGHHSGSFVENQPTLNQEITITGLTILNASNPMAGEAVQVRVFMQNPAAIEIESLLLNDIDVPVSGGDGITSAIVELIPDFAGGIYLVEINGVSYQSYGKLLFQNVSSTYTDEILILGSIDIVDMRSDYGLLIGDDVDNHVLLTLDNPTGYDVSELVLSYYGFQSVNNHTYAAADIEWIDANTISVAWYGSGYVPGYLYQEVSVQSVTYGLPGHDYSVTYPENTFQYFILLYEVFPHAITGYADLVGIQSGYNYVLETDIDMSSHTWTPLDFFGVLDGNNHVIRNLSIVVNNPLTSTQAIGLFAEFEGLVTDLTMEDAYLSVNTGGQAHVGILAGYAYHCTLRNVSVSGDIVQGNPDTTGSYKIGGIAGTCAGDVANVTVDVDISVNTGNSAGIGLAFGSLSGIITGSTVTGTVNATGNSISVGGLAAGFMDINAYNNNVTLSAEVEATNFSFGGMTGGCDWGTIIEDNRVEASLVAQSDNPDSWATIGGLFSGGADVIANRNEVLFTCMASFGTLRAGGLIGSAYGGETVQNSVYGTMSLTATKAAGENWIGGLAGSLSGDVMINLTDLSIDLDSSGSARLGGMIGYATGGTLQENLFVSHHTAQLEKTITPSTIGGITGYAEGTTIRDNIMEGSLEVSSMSPDLVGGIAGRMTSNSNAFDNLVSGSIAYVGDTTLFGSVGALAGQAMESEVSDNLFLGDIAITVTNSNFDIGLIGNPAMATISNNWSAYDATMVVNDSAYTLEGETAEIAALDSGSFYQVTLGWDEKIWDWTNLDHLQGGFPVLKAFLRT